MEMKHPEYVLIGRWDFMVMSRWYGYTYDEALTAWNEQSGGKSGIAVTQEEFNLIGTDKSNLYKQKHPVSDEQKQQWIKEAMAAI